MSRSTPDVPAATRTIPAIPPGLAGGGGGTLTTGTYATAAAAPGVGDHHVCTDTPIERWCFVANTWTDTLPGSGIVTPPDLTDFSTALNFGGSTATQVGHAAFSWETAAGSYQLRGRMKARASGAKRYRLHFETAFVGDAAVGLFFHRVASDDQWAAVLRTQGGVTALQTWYFASGVLSGNPTPQVNQIPNDRCNWLEIYADGVANMSVNYGVFGQSLSADIGATAWATHLGGEPDFVGICGWQKDGAVDTLMNAYHWEES